MPNLYELHPNQQLGAEPNFAARAALGARHARLLVGFVVTVLMPLAFFAFYLFGFAQDRFVSYSGFSITVEDSAVQLGVLEGLASLSGGAKTDAAIVYDFLNGPAFASKLKAHAGAIEMLSPIGFDPLFWRPPDGLEGLTDRWRRLAKVSLDSRTGMVSARVSAFRAEDARYLNQLMLEEASAMLAGLSRSMRDESTILAQGSVQRAEDRLTAARQRLTEFRSLTRIVDPMADFEGRLGMMTTLQTQLVEAKVSLELLHQNSTGADLRIASAKNKVLVIEALLEDEKNLVDQEGAGYAKIAAGFDARMTDVTYAQEHYLTALASLDAANALAQRKTRHLAVHIPPTLADAAVLPRRWSILGTSAFFLCLAWAVGVAAFHGARGNV